MKVELKIKEITNDDLVDLFSNGIKKGLQAAATNEDTADHFMQLAANDAYDLDLTGGESLLQSIMFNEVIYG